jgi:hypothetical protein
MTRKNIQYCSLAGLGRITVLQAQGRRGLDDVMGSRASRAQGGGQRSGPGDDAGRWHRGLRNGAG